MIFNSQDESNVKRATMKREIGHVRIDDYEVSILSEIDKLVKKHKIDRAKVKFYQKPVEVDEFHTQQWLVFYYEEQENNTEYFNRIEKLQLKDIQDCAQALSRFILLTTKKEEIHDLYNKFKHKRQLSDWQKEQMETFLSSISTEEKIDKAYKKGCADGKRQLDELKQKIKDLSKMHG